MDAATDRKLISSIGGLTRWAGVHGKDERAAATQPARDGRRAKLAAQVVAEAGRDLTDAEVDAAVETLRRAHYRRMALASARARRKTA